MFRDWFVRYKYSVLFVLFLACFYGHSIGRVYGFTFFPDEFGYWAYAARLAGYDWSHITALGSYYSYGYSLLLFPVFKLCTDPVIAYRAAVTLNFLLMGAVYFLLLRLAAKFCGTREERDPLCAAVVVFYPCWLFYARSTMVEIVLVAAYAAICVLIYDYFENNRWTTLVLLVVLLVCIHFVHMRAVAVLAAGALTLLACFLMQSGRSWQFATAALVGAVVLVGGFAIKDRIQDSLYMMADAAAIHINDYTGQFEKTAYLFTREGIQDFAEGTAGKILYLGLSSFGLAYWGIWYAVREVWQMFRKMRGGADVRGLFYVFILLSTVGETLVNAVYNVRPARVDSVIYGRYHEFVLPVLMFLGIRELLHTTRLWRGTALIAVMQFPMVMAAAHCIERYQLTNLHGYVAAGMSYGYVRGAMDFDAVRFVWSAYGLGILLTFLVAAVIAVVRGRGTLDFLLVIIVMAEFLLSVRVSSMYTDEAAKWTYRDIAIVGKIQELRAEEPERRVIYLLEDEWSFISVLQFMMRDEEIHLLPLKDSMEAYPEEELGRDDILVLFYQSSFTQEAEKKYASYLLSGHFYIYYNR